MEIPAATPELSVWVQPYGERFKGTAVGETEGVTVLLLAAGVMIVLPTTKKTLTKIPASSELRSFYMVL